MRRACLLPLFPLLLLVSAGPATRPTTAPAQRLIVQIRHVELAANPGQPAPALIGPLDQPVPADAKERSSLQVTATVGEPFEAVAVINGTTYRFAGKLRALRDDAHALVEVDYSETSGDVARSVAEIRSNVTVMVDRTTRLGGLSSGAGASAIMVTVKRVARPVG